MRDKNWRKIAIASLVALGLYVIGSVIYSKVETLEAQGTVQELAEPVDDLCTTNAQAKAQIGEEKCKKAAEVQAEPQIPVIIEGTDGVDGRGITGTRMDGESLIVSYTDGAEQNVGVVVGENGKPGANGVDGVDGVDGRGITGTAIAEGQLQLNYTDGTSEFIGVVVGQDGADGSNGINGDDGVDGRGVASTQGVEGRLIITYTDGTIEDAGPLPIGPAGPICPQGTQLLERQVMSDTLPPVQETWFVCVQDGA